MQIRKKILLLCVSCNLREREILQSMLFSRYIFTLVVFILLIACAKQVIQSDSAPDSDTSIATLTNIDKTKLFYRGDSTDISLADYENGLNDFNQMMKVKISKERNETAQKKEIEEQTEFALREKKRKKAFLEKQQLQQLQIAETTQEPITEEVEEDVFEEIASNETIIDETFIEDILNHGIADEEEFFTEELASNEMIADEEEITPIALLNLLETKDEAVSHTIVQANYYHYIGWELAGLGDYDGAINSYRRALEYDPNDATPHNSIGIAKVALGDIDGAIEEYNHAIRINPYYPAAFHNRGKAKSNAGDYQGAVEDYRRALRLNVKVGLVYLDMAVAQYKRGNHQEALKDADKALELGAEDAINIAKQIKNQEL